MLKFLDWLVPRFITEYVALKEINFGEYEIVCSMKDLGEYEHADAKVLVTTFNLFGFGLFPKLVGEIENC